MRIILAHGVLGFGAIDIFSKHIEYFNGVAEDLEAKGGISVLAPFVSPIGPVRERGEALAKAIEQSVDRGERAIIIGHSMGGLDARFALSQIDGIASRVAALVTIGTPHHGSPIADLLSASHTLHRLLGIEAPLLRELESTIALHDLTTDAAKKFENDNPDRPDVLYRYIAGSGRHVALPAVPLFHTSMPFAGTFAIMAAMGLVNDGMVPFASATRGLPAWEVWETDHAEEIGWNLDRLSDGPPAEHLARYRRIVDRLTEELAQ